MSRGPDLRILDLKAGSEGAFRALYREHKAEVYAFLVRLTGDRHVAADLFQNVWMKLVRNAARLAEDTNLRAWLLTVARYEFIDYRRAQIFDLSRFLAFGREVADTAQREWTDTSEVEAALRRLGDADREALLLVAVHQLSHEQAQRALGISASAWRKRLSRARQRLASELERLARSDPQGTVARATRGARG